jgi:hypothetical protein
MNLNLPEGLFAKKKRLIIALSITMILVVAIYGATIVVDLGTSSDPVNALITVENTISRLGDGVVMDASNSSGKIKGYIWDLGDGNTSTNVSVNHHYELAGWYDVNLTVVGPNGQTSTNSIVVGVQQIDNEADQDLSRLIWVTGGMMGNLVKFPCGPNIGNPTTEVRIHLEGAVGNLGISLWFYEGGRRVEIYSESFIATGGEFDYSHTFQPFDIPIEAQSRMSEIAIVVWIDEGKWRSGNLYMNVIFPIENIAP